MTQATATGTTTKAETIRATALEAKAAGGKLARLGPERRAVLLRALAEALREPAARKTIFEVKKLDYVAAPWIGGEPNEDIAKWAGESSGRLDVIFRLLANHYAERAALALAKIGERSGERSGDRSLASRMEQAVRHETEPEVVAAVRQAVATLKTRGP